MKQFIIKLSLFVSIFILAMVIGILIGYGSLNNSRYFKLSNKINFIVLGHSHPECAFNDSLISGLVNFAASGEAYFYTYLKVKKIIPNNKQIKAVFIEFGNSQIDTVMDSWTWDNSHIFARFPRYFPLLEYSDFKFLWGKNSTAILECPPKSFIKEFGYNFSSMFINSKGIRSNDRFGGYLYLVRDKTDSLINRMSIDNHKVKTEYKISTTNIKYLAKIIDFCTLNKVKVFLIRSPLHPKSFTNNGELRFRTVLNSHFSNIEFLDFKDFPLQNNEFGDLGHLNYKGARIFSIFFNKLLDLNLIHINDKQVFINNEISKLSFSEPVNIKFAKKHTSKITFK